MCRLEFHVDYSCLLVRASKTDGCLHKWCRYGSENALSMRSAIHRLVDMQVSDACTTRWKKNSFDRLWQKTSIRQWTTVQHACVVKILKWKWYMQRLRELEALWSQWRSSDYCHEGWTEMYSSQLWWTGARKWKEYSLRQRRLLRMFQMCFFSIGFSHTVYPIIWWRTLDLNSWMRFSQHYASLSDWTIWPQLRTTPWRMGE